MRRTALITGFEPYGTHRINPTARLVEMFEGTMIAGLEIKARCLPVRLDGLLPRLQTLFDEVRPALVIALGLYPGESMIRLERFGVNLADFEIGDNDGVKLVDASLEPQGNLSRAATLPLRAIASALLAAGIPAHLSTTAGTYLCNATLFTLLGLIERSGRAVPCGFIHLPYLPEQVALTLEEAAEGRIELHQRADLASMDFALMRQALKLAIEVSALGLN
ncbi:MAG TPA: hypothetical protein VKT70_08655 [Stellaceae bacterium]|nr:hypothetical protein [Stellaceae bacterium]